MGVNEGIGAESDRRPLRLDLCAEFEIRVLNAATRSSGHTVMNNTYITPSTSPAPLRRTSDGPSPTKRPRLASSSTPSSTSVSTPSAFSNQTYHIANPNSDGVDLHETRRASSSRILNFWSQLAERYSRPLAEDDIVDLRDIRLVKDRNVMRSDPHQYDIGCFGRLDDGGTETPTDEGSDDELDAFAPGADISDELEMERVNREGLVPVREMDPADAADLKEFLEAEKRRKEQFGSEGDDEGREESMGCESGEDDGVESVGGYSEVALLGVTPTEESTDEVEDELIEDSQWWAGPDDASLGLERELELHSDFKDDAVSDDSLVDLNSGSDDELGIWDHQDEGSIVYAIAGDLDPDEVSGKGIIELPLPESDSSPSKRGRGRPRKATQKRAPSPPARAKSRSKSRRNISPPVVQLHSPPQSTSSATGTFTVRSLWLS